MHIILYGDCGKLLSLLYINIFHLIEYIIVTIPFNRYPFEDKMFNRLHEVNTLDDHTPHDTVPQKIIILMKYPQSDKLN